LTSSGDKDPETERESDADKELRTGGTERIVENSGKDSKEVENEDGFEDERGETEK
jgi:hypothetical protein